MFRFTIRDVMWPANKAMTAPHRRRARGLQFSLRMLLIVLTISSFPCGLYAWRHAREERQARLVEEFNAAVEERRFFDAHAIAHRFYAEEPNSAVAEVMIQKSRLLIGLSCGVDYFENGTGCLAAP